MQAEIHEEYQWWKQISWLRWCTKSTTVSTRAGDVQTEPEIALISQIRWRSGLCEGVGGSLFHSLPSSQHLLAIPYSTRARSCCVTGLRQRPHSEKPVRRLISCIFASVTLRCCPPASDLLETSDKATPNHVCHIQCVCRVEVLCQS